MWLYYDYINDCIPNKLYISIHNYTHIHVYAHKHLLLASLAHIVGGLMWRHKKSKDSQKASSNTKYLLLLQ